MDVSRYDVHRVRKSFVDNEYGINERDKMQIEKMVVIRPESL